MAKDLGWSHLSDVQLLFLESALCMRVDYLNMCLATLEKGTNDYAHRVHEKEFIMSCIRDVKRHLDFSRALEERRLAQDNFRDVEVSVTKRW